MLAAPERDYLYQYACIPEQVPEYVTAISGAEPFLLNDQVIYAGTGTLVFVGYPLTSPFDPDRLREQLQMVIKRFRPEYLSLIAPLAPGWSKPMAPCTSDHYYRLDLERFAAKAKVLYMLRRASRELSVEMDRQLDEAHVRCLGEFLEAHEIGEAHREIFTRAPAYVAAVPTSRVFSARDGSGRLVAFTVAEFGAKDYAFYLFNFRSRSNYVPGASDLLLYEVITAARDMGKVYVNFGLGLHAGVEFFKKKWGAYPFLRHEHCLYRTARASLVKSLVQHLEL